MSGFFRHNRLSPLTRGISCCDDKRRVTKDKNTSRTKELLRLITSFYSSYRDLHLLYRTRDVMLNIEENLLV